MLSDSVFSLQGKTALVTGGGRGLGRAVALSLCQAGADVAVTSRTTQELAAVRSEIESYGKKALDFSCDVTDRKQVAAVVDSVLDQWGQIDILVCNAGIAENESALNIKPANWERLINVNLNGTFNFAQLVGRHMVARKSGKIIIVASVVGLRGGSGVYLHYSTSKGALISLTRALAIEWAKHNVMVNAIAPGAFYSKLTGRLQDKKIEESFINKIPLRRIATPEQIAPLAVYLASGASDYVTGEVIVVDGGINQC